MQAHNLTTKKDNEFEEQSLPFTEIEQVMVSLDNVIADISPKSSAQSYFHSQTTSDILPSNYSSAPSRHSPDPPDKAQSSFNMSSPFSRSFQEAYQGKDRKGADVLIQAQTAIFEPSAPVVDNPATSPTCALSVPSSSPATPAAPFQALFSTPDFAFAFDIDGVLENSGKPLPLAAETLQLLDRNRIPFIFLTNSGGRTENLRVTELSKKFGVRLSEDNFIQSHTPFKNLVPEFSDKTVLVLGGVGNRCRDVAEYYGYKNVITAADIMAAYPNYWPFNEVNPDYFRSMARPLPAFINPSDLTSCLKVDAIFVFSSPRDWGLEAQIITDLLLSHRGYLGTVSPLNGDSSLPNNGYQQDGQPTLYYSNGDFVWSTLHHQPRFGQGAFREAVEGIWRASTGQPCVLKHVLGKPSDITYTYAETMLVRHRNTLLADCPHLRPLRTVFMVGDNPESDIRGANEFNSPAGINWRSLLVETGVHSAGDVPAHTPAATLPNVLEAIRWALREEGWPVES